MIFVESITTESGTKIVKLNPTTSPWVFLTQIHARTAVYEQTRTIISAVEGSFVLVFPVDVTPIILSRGIEV